MSQFAAGSALWSATTTATSTWRTPPEVFDPLHRAYRIGLDVAALASSALIPFWCGPDHPDVARRDAFALDWRAARHGGARGDSAAYCNPPYGRDVGRWIALCRQWGEVIPVVALVLARTDTRWWSDEVDRHAAEVRFVRGRVRFLRPDGSRGESAPAPSVVIVWRPGHAGAPALGTLTQDIPARRGTRRR